MKFCKKIFALAMLTACSLIGQEEEENSPMTIHSGEAEYNGQEISLVGDVVVQHGLGTISAHRFSLSVPDDKNKHKFSYLTMSEKVSIDFQNGGRLTCEKAEVNYDQMQGNFFGSQDNPDVIYSYSETESANNKKMPRLIIKGLQMQIGFVRAKEKKSKAELNQIQIDEQVRVDYNKEYFLQADKAFYQHDLLETQNKKAGTLTLSVNQHPFCVISNFQGDKIFAKVITVDTLKYFFDLTEPHGSLLHRYRNEAQKINFSADHMSWDQKGMTLTLNGHVDVGDTDNLLLKTDHQLIITHRLVDGKKEIRTIFCPQETEITFFDIKKESPRKIMCHGSLLIDQENLQVWMHSPKDEQGQVLENKQIFFDDLMGEMCADSVQMHYERQEKQFLPKKINLLGNVQIFNRFDGHVQESSSVLQYALADQVEYLPESQDMLLTGKNGNRVLFFDKINSLQMSAPGLKIHLDQTTRKESVQGIGDVRFTFIEREFNQLKARFRMNEKPSR